MSRIVALIALSLFFLAQNPTLANAQNTWTLGKKTYQSDNVLPGSRMDVSGGPDTWTLSASTVINDPAGSTVASLEFSFSTVGMPPAGRYKIVDLGEPRTKNTVSITANISDPTNDIYAFSCTGGKGDQYITVSIKDGRVMIQMPPTPATDNTMEKKEQMSATLMQTEDAE